MPAVALPRLVLLAVSLAAAGWFALGAHEAHDEQAAQALLSRLGALRPAELTHAASLLDASDTLDPDSHIDVLRAELALHRHRVSDARRILDTVVAREPKAIEAWALLADALKRVDPAAARHARAEVLRLAPPVPQP